MNTTLLLASVCLSSPPKAPPTWPSDTPPTKAPAVVINDATQCPGGCVGVHDQKIDGCGSYGCVSFGGIGKCPCTESLSSREIVSPLPIPPVGYGVVNNGPNRGQMFQLYPSIAPVVQSVQQQCYTNPVTGVTVCPVQTYRR